MPEELIDEKIYIPKERGFEKTLIERKRFIDSIKYPE